MYLQCLIHNNNRLFKKTAAIPEDDGKWQVVILLVCLCVSAG
jgi:hypothetical protein